MRNWLGLWQNLSTNVCILYQIFKWRTGLNCMAFVIACWKGLVVVLCPVLNGRDGVQVIAFKWKQGKTRLHSSRMRVGPLQWPFLLHACVLPCHTCTMDATCPVCPEWPPCTLPYHPCPPRPCTPMDRMTHANENTVVPSTKLPLRAVAVTDCENFIFIRVWQPCICAAGLAINGNEKKSSTSK